MLSPIAYCVLKYILTEGNVLVIGNKINEWIKVKESMNAFGKRLIGVLLCGAPSCWRVFIGMLLHGAHG